MEGVNESTELWRHPNARICLWHCYKALMIKHCLHSILNASLCVFQMTFDNKFYDFSGSQGCSYLLMSDFLHNRFSVVANYGEDTKRTSITVITDNKRVDIETKPSEDGETIKVLGDPFL